ncbi:MAG: DegV family protein [Clostridia bacterium]|nr:DegV family protein [Clostridia bacterium]
MQKFKIVADSSADIKVLDGCAFAAAPLKIITSEKEYRDDALLDVAQMVEDLSAYKGKSHTSCPNTEDWLRAFEDAEYIFVVTITSHLSGSFNTASTAKDLYCSMYPERKVFVIDSLSTGPEMCLIIEKIADFIAQGLFFEQICERITEYQKRTALLFMLKSVKNLANNGRINPLVAKVVGFLGIRIVGKASNEGELQTLDKCRGEEKALDALVARMKEMGYDGGRVLIAHCLNPSEAEKLKARLQKKMGDIPVSIYACGGLCSFYAEKGGLLIGFERNI